MDELLTCESPPPEALICPAPVASYPPTAAPVVPAGANGTTARGAAPFHDLYSDAAVAQPVYDRLLPGRCTDSRTLSHSNNPATIASMDHLVAQYQRTGRVEEPVVPTLPPLPYNGPSISASCPGEGVPLAAEDQRLLNAGMPVPFAHTPQGQALNAITRGGPATTMALAINAARGNGGSTTEINRIAAGTAPADGLLEVGAGVSEPPAMNTTLASDPIGHPGERPLP